MAITDLFGGNSNWQNPADAAQPYLSQIGDKAGQYFSPYIGAGMNAMPVLQDQFSKLLNSPEFLANMGSQYQASPGYQYQVNQAKEAANQAYAAGGMSGTPAQQVDVANRVNQIANQDYNQWLNNALGAYKMGLGGYGGLNQMGFDASQQMVAALMEQLMSQANAAYSGVENQNQANDRESSGWGNLLGGVGSVIGNIPMPGGGTLTSAIGKKVGNFIGNRLS